MQLTKGQKDAIARKAEIIVEERKKAKYEEFKKNWKPNKEQKNILNKLEEIDALCKKVRKMFKDINFKPQYGGSYGTNLSDTNWIYYDPAEENSLDELENRMREYDFNNSDIVKTSYPDFYQIVDEIELLNLDKTFNLDSFLNKYRNL